MKSNLAAGTIFSLLFWSLLSVSLFAAPMMSSNRAADPASEIQDLIRQHHEATSPMQALPPAQAGADECLAAPGEETVVDRGDADAGPTLNEASPDAPIIRPVGKRPDRIQV
jgi:hypothetical protein